MKRLIFIIYVVFCIQILNAQFIVPVDKVNKYITEYGILPDHTYYKDVNKVLNKYVGTWEGVYKNQTYYFEITKQTKVRSSIFPSVFRDDLLIKFKITDNRSKKVIRNTFNLPDDSLINLSLLTEITENKHVMLYYGGDNEQVNCGDIGDIYLEPFDKNQKLRVYVVPQSMVFYVEDGVHPCPGGRILPPFPDSKETALILTKKN